MLNAIKKWLKGNPTAGWTGNGMALSLDVSRGEFIGHPLGSSMESFRPLGKADDWYQSPESVGLTYKTLGVSLDFEQGKLTGVLLEMYALGGPWRAFTGAVLADGRRLDVRAGADAASILSMFGEPNSRDDDETETILKYRRGDVVAEFEIEKADGLYAINVWLDDAPRT